MNVWLPLLCLAGAGSVSAWYNTSSLESCSSNNVWDNIDEDDIETTIEELKEVLNTMPNKIEITSVKLELR